MFDEVIEPIKNYLPYLFVFSKTILISYSVNKLISKSFEEIFLNKEFKVKDIRNISLPNMVRLNDNVSFYVNDDLLYKDEINYFKNNIINKIDINLLTNFYNNLDTLKVIKQELKDASGTYSAQDNLITIGEETNSTLYHELFHMASSVKERNAIRSGFSYRNLSNDTYIGRGINEGYTEIINSRYSNDDKPTYYYNRNIASLVEEIVTKDKMEKLYFTGDLYGLIYELSNYETYDNIMCFLTYSDFYLKHIWDKNINKNKKKKIDESVIYSYVFLIRCYYNKIKNDRNVKLKMNLFVNKIIPNINTYHYSLSLYNAVNDYGKLLSKNYKNK